MITYLQKLGAVQERNHSWLCIGLDPLPQRLPLKAMRWDEPVLPFNKAIIDHTADLVCAYKPNLGFYLQWGASGVIALERTIAYIPDHIPVILDCKIGDISHTQSAWGRGIFDLWEVDAVTVNPFAGSDAVLPLLQGRPQKAVYVLARTSNSSALDFQGELARGRGLSAEVIRRSREWVGELGSGGAGERGSRLVPSDAEGGAGEQGSRGVGLSPAKSGEEWRGVMGHCGYVVGATYPAELAAARRLAPDASFLIPGIGAQGGELAAAVRYGPDLAAGPVINAGRSVLYASPGLDFAEAARAAALRLRNEINRLREAT